MKYRILLTCCISGVALAGCMSQPTEYDQGSTSNRPAVVWTMDSATEDEIASAKKEVISQLKDPESAQFREIWALSGSNGNRSVCGYVNAKNSYGGYTGNKMFTIVSTGSVVIEGSGAMGSLLPGICMPRTVK